MLFNSAQIQYNIIYETELSPIMKNFWQQQLEPLKLFKTTLLTLLSVGCALIAFILYLLLTPQGAKTTLNLIKYATRYDIQYHNLKGSLLDGLSIEALKVIGPDLDIQADELLIGYHFTTLIKQNYSLDFLKAKNVVIKTNYKDMSKSFNYDDKNLSSLNEMIKGFLPIQVKVNNLDLENATIVINDYTHKIDSLVIENATNDLFSIKDVHYKGSLGRVDAELGETIKINWDIVVDDHPLLNQYGSRHLQSKGEIAVPSQHIQQSISTASFKFDELKLDHHVFKDIRIEVKGSLDKHQISLSSQYQNYPLETQLLGHYHAKAWQAEIKSFRTKAPRFQAFQSKGKVLVNWQGTHIRTDANLMIADKLPIETHFEMAQAKPYTLTGTFKTAIADIRSLSEFAPNLSNIRGSVNANLNITGSLAKVKLTGLITLKDAKLKANNIGKHAYLNALNVKLNDNFITLDGKGTWGSSVFYLSGDGELSANPTLNLNFKGEKLLLSDTPDYYIVGSPDLNLSLKKQRPHVSGKIFIDEAEIRGLKNHNHAPSEDVVIVSAQKKIKPLSQQSFEQFAPIDSQIEIILSDKVTYKGYGISTHVGGKLLISQENSTGPLAKGRLLFRKGQYKGYGKTFNIEYGQILFSGGPINDPILDIRAQRTIQPHQRLASFSTTQPIMCGIHFTGNLKTPKISFYSDPAMSDADIMSYLVVGRPQNQVQGAQAELLYEAVSQLTRMIGSSRKDVQFDLAEQLHLTQMGFSKKENADLTSQVNNRNPLEDTVFVLGKQLSDKLYLQYTHGILDSASTFGIRYSLGKNVTVEAATGTQGSSADVLLSFEGH